MMIRIDKQMHRKKIVNVQVKLILIQYLFSWFLFSTKACKTII